MAKVARLNEEDEKEWEARLKFWEKELQRVQATKPNSGSPIMIAKVASGGELVRNLPGFEIRLSDIQGFIKKYKKKLGIKEEAKK